MHYAYAMGYETALEKIGFVNVSIMDYLTKLAAAGGMSVQELRKKVLKQEMAKGQAADPELLSRLHARSGQAELAESQQRLQDLERELAGERAYRAQVSGHRAKAETGLAEAQAARKAEGSAYQKALGEMGKQHNKYQQGIGGIARGFGKLKPWQRGAVLGGGGLAALGIGAGLGHALSD